MTTCCRSSDIKSSVYNQTGEGFFQQLSAYNHMSSHLRRIHSAKCRVDSRNPNYVQKLQRARYLQNEKILNKDISQELIDRLAYDTQHHPMDILRMSCNINNRCVEKFNQNQSKGYECCSSTYVQYPGSRIQSVTIHPMEDEQNRSMSRTRTYGSGPTFHSARPARGQRNNNWRSHDEVYVDGISSRRDGQISVNSSIHSSSRSNKSKNDNDPMSFNYASSFESSSETSQRGSSVAKVLAPSPSLVESIPSTQRQGTTNESCTKFNKDDEEAKYSKFLYDITQEIVQYGYFTDEQLKNVFNKHIQKNLHILDKKKMMHELCQLKLALNIVDQQDEEEDESIEQFTHNQRFSQLSIVKPPTPPKVLDDNKFIDKLKNPEELREAYSKSPASGRNTVVLIDANPELVITERDILATLMKMNIDPKQAQTVYKELQKKSKEINNFHMVQPERRNVAIQSSAPQKAKLDKYKIQSINRDVQYPGRDPMNINRYYTPEKDELLINRDYQNCQPKATSKFSCQGGKRSNIRQDDIYNSRVKNKPCQCGSRILEVRSPHFSNGHKKSSGHQSIKSKTQGKKYIEIKKKEKMSRELIDNQSAYTSRINRRKTSLSSQLEGLRSGRVKKNIGSGIKNFQLTQESSMREHPSVHNNNSKVTKSEPARTLKKVAIASSTNRNKEKKEAIEFFADNERNETTEVSNSITDSVSKPPDPLDEEYNTDDSYSSFMTSINDDESIEEKKSSNNDELNVEDRSISESQSNAINVNDRVHYNIRKIIDENTQAENQFEPNYGNKTLIEFPMHKNFINSERETSNNNITPEVSDICICNNIPSNLNMHSVQSWFDKSYREKIDRHRAIDYTNMNYQVSSDSISLYNELVLCESCKNRIEYK